MTKKNIIYGHRGSLRGNFGGNCFSAYAGGKKGIFYSDFRKKLNYNFVEAVSRIVRFADS